MSSLIGLPTDRWPLARAIDALGDAARQAGRPGLVWIVGVFYPSVTLGLGSTWSLFSTDDADTASKHHFLSFAVGGQTMMLSLDLLKIAGLSLCIGIFLFPLFRLVGGLARIAPPEVWHAACAERRTPRIRALWAAGKGMTVPVMGLWILLIVMVASALVVMLLPAEIAARSLFTVDAADAHDTLNFVLRALVLGPFVLFMLSYSLAISVLSQLAIQSLSHNRRGVGSALLHGWRIMRHDVWATTRAVIVDALLSLSVLFLWRLLSGVVHFESLSQVLFVVLSGFAGVARAGYWARAYRALGGLSPDDGVPGLSAA